MKLGHILCFCFAATGLASALITPHVTLDDCGVELQGFSTLVAPWRPGQKGNNTRQVAHFLGIPYALPPTRSRRWRPPVETSPHFCPWSMNNVSASVDTSPSVVVKNATKKGNQCPQVPGYDWGAEDCLNLNVFVPTAVLDRKKSDPSWTGVPVFVDLTCGDFTFTEGGTAQLSFLSAFASGENDEVDFSSSEKSSLAAVSDSVITISVRFRIGILGFLSIKQLAEEQGGFAGNYGIMDQIMALKWIQRHISSFGGDASRVTIAGMSSGGTAIYALLTSPMASGLFQRALSLSGSPNITMDAATKQRQDARIVQRLGCSDDTDSTCGGSIQGKSVLDCLRNLSVNAIVNATPSSWSLVATMGFTYLNNHSAKGLDLPGVLHVDGRVVPFALFDAISKAGRGSGDVYFNTNVSVMMGSDGQENSIFPSRHPSLKNANISELSQFFAEKVFNTWDNASEVGSAVGRLYAREVISVDAQCAADSLQSDWSVTCGNRHLSALLAGSPLRNVTTAPVYSFVNQWPPQKRYPKTSWEYGWASYACHMWQYDSATQTYGQYEPYSEDLAFSRLIRSHWYEFMVNGSLSTRHQWPPVKEASCTTPTHCVPDGMYVYCSPHTRMTGLCHNQTGVHLQYKAKQCDYLENVLGIDKRYWWAN